MHSPSLIRLPLSLATSAIAAVAALLSRPATTRIQPHRERRPEAVAQRMAMRRSNKWLRYDRADSGTWSHAAFKALRRRASW